MQACKIQSFVNLQNRAVLVLAIGFRWKWISTSALSSLMKTYRLQYIFVSLNSSGHGRVQIHCCPLLFVGNAFETVIASYSFLDVQFSRRKVALPFWFYQWKEACNIYSSMKHISDFRPNVFVPLTTGPCSVVIFAFWYAITDLYHAYRLFTRPSCAFSRNKLMWLAL